MGYSIKIPRIKKRLNEMFAGKIDLSDDTGKSDNHLFESRSIAALGLMMKSALDTSASSMHITDGYNDLGIDAIYLDESQKVLFVVQSKWREDGNGSISHSEMQSFVEGIEHLIDFDLSGSNRKIQSKKSDVDKAITGMGYQIFALFVHSGDQKIKTYDYRPMKDLLNSVNDESNTLVEFFEISQNDIYTYLSKGINSDEIVIDDVVLSNWGVIDDPIVSYYGMINASTIGSWYKTYGNRLFDENLRFYKGNTEVNDGIKRVLINEPENFIYYNNGIKLLCRKITRKLKESTKNDMGIFYLEGVSLVNGAQTTGCIGEELDKHPDKVGEARVMIQIIDLSKAEDNMAKQITKLSNTQNRIENRDFAAQDPVHERIRQDLSFSHLSYLYKGGDKVTDPQTQITYDESIVAIACLQEDIGYTITAKKNVGALSEDINRPPYKILFNTGTNAYVLANSVMILREVEESLQNKRNDLDRRQFLVSVHGNRFIAHCVLQKLKLLDGFDSSVMDGEFLRSQTNSIVDGLIDSITSVLNEYYADSYPASVFKNAAKCKLIFDSIQD